MTEAPLLSPTDQSPPDKPLEWALEGGDHNTNLAHLLKLYNSGDNDGFDLKLEEIVFDSLMQERLFTNNIARIHDKSTPKDERQAIVEAQRRIFEERKQAVLREIGISSKSETEQFEEKREAIRQKLLEKGINGTETEEEVLKTLGIIETNDDGQETFSYPSEMFPDTTNDKWETYLGSVKKHIVTSRELKSGLSSQEDVTLADRTRRIAHNAVAKDVDALFGLGLLPESTWDFEKTRQLVIKMRERRFPTIKTGEKHTTTKAVALGLAAAAALAEQHEQ